MNLTEQIEHDYITAYKNKEERKTSVLRMVKSALKNAEIAQKAPLDDDATIKVLRREAKQRLEAASEYEKAGHPERAEGERGEAELIKAYLPAAMSTEEIEKIVKSVIAELKAENMADMGKVMGMAVKKSGGQADPATVAAIVKENLSEK